MSTRQGHAELGLGYHAAASAAFERALPVARDNGRFEADVRAGLASTALAQGDPAAAMRWLQPVLDSLASGGVPKGAEERHLIRLTCWKATNAAGDPRAAQLLETAHNELQVSAAAITDDVVRQRYLTRNPAHRGIVAAWAAQKAAAT